MANPAAPLSQPGYSVWEAITTLFGYPKTETKPAQAEEEPEENNDNLRDPVPGEEMKMVLVVRTDLGMSSGKIAAQAGHATLACYKTLTETKKGRSILKAWEKTGQAKIALAAGSARHLDKLYRQAKEKKLNPHYIQDAGRTQIDPGTITVLGIGPASKSQVDEVTRKLSLL